MAQGNYAFITTFKHDKNKFKLIYATKINLIDNVGQTTQIFVHRGGGGEGEGSARKENYELLLLLLNSNNNNNNNPIMDFILSIQSSIRQIYAVYI